MKTKFRILLSTTLAAMTLAGAARAENSLTFQGVTFDTVALSGNELQFTITNALNATGDWAGIKYLEAFDFQNITSSADVDPSTYVTPAGFTLVDHELSAHGCASGDPSGSVCFTAGSSPIALTNNMVFDIFFGATAGLNLNSPDLKVDFWSSSTAGKSTGSLLSMPLPTVIAVPEPGAYAMLLAGLGLMGMVARRRKLNVA